jgi:plasmid stability protein
MAKKVKTTFYVDEDVMRAIRVSAARQGRPVSQVVDEALRQSTLLGIFERIAARFDLDPDEAERIAYEELRAARNERAASRA